MRTDRFTLVATGILTLVLAGVTIVVYGGEKPGAEAATTVDGRTVFRTKGCIGCHALDSVPGGGSIGPDLTGLAEVAGSRVAGLSPSAYVRQSVREPAAFTVPGYPTDLMPTLSLTDSEVDALVTYLLGDDVASG